MFNRLLCAAVLAVFFALPAKAAIVSYEYQGQPLHRIQGGPDYSTTLPGFSGRMVIDEELFGKSMVSNTITFVVYSWPGLPEWLLEFDVFYLGEISNTVQFKTDANRNIIEWDLFSLGDPHSSTITHNRDGYALWYGDIYYLSDGPGSWSVVPVPIPASPILLLTALVGLAIRRQVARRSF